MSTFSEIDYRLLFPGCRIVKSDASFVIDGHGCHSSGVIILKNISSTPQSSTDDLVIN